MTDLVQLYLDYEIISVGFPGWDIKSIKAMTKRERVYWAARMKWRREMLNNG